MKKIFKFIVSIPSYIASGFVWVYKTCISPLLPHTCRWTPSCSIYSLEAFNKWGFIKGLGLSINRVFRCTPHAKGGLDPVPYNIKGDFKWVL